MSLKAEEDTAHARAEQFVIDVGSGLSTADWSDIDDKDVVAKTKSSESFKLMLVIQPYEASAAERGVALLAEKVFEWMYVQRSDVDLYKKAVKECFPTLYEYAREDKDFKAQMKASSATKVVEELTDMKHSDNAAYTLQWLEVLAEAALEPSKLLNLKRFAITQGKDSIEDQLGNMVWEKASSSLKAKVGELMFDYSNKPDAGPVARRYQHQEQLMQLVDGHLKNVAHSQTRPDLGDNAVGFAALPPLPPALHMILSTPTGSGKTFTAIMLHLQLMKQQHPGMVLVYSVPTKQVLKRVGQECEAHNIAYWTAARDGDLHQVRRPYSIRTKRSKGLKQEDVAKSGTIMEQLKQAAQMGQANQDHGNGHPSIIIADLYSAAAMCVASHEEARGSAFHHANIVLYFDEPNMGIHLDPKVMKIVQTIMEKKPLTTILASATMPGWEQLEDWWKGDAEESPERVVVTQAPYGLPMSHLHVFNESEGKLRAVSMLSLFPSWQRFHAAVESNPRLRVLLLRHLLPAQAQALLAANASAEEKELAWGGLFGSVKALRQTVEPRVQGLEYAPFHDTRSAWRAAPPRPAAGLKGLLSAGGITMIATLEPHQVAMNLAGKQSEAEWHEEIHKLKNKVKEVERTHKQAQRDRERVKKEDLADASNQVETGALPLRAGLTVNVADTTNCDMESLLMLSKGIVYSCAEGTEPLVKKLYQQALLSIPEKAMTKKQPPIHTLVVDYSSVYGTDCPAVDTIIMLEDLGRLLTWEDHQQFLGRLRRDGQAIYMSMATLRRAALGDAGGEPLPSTAPASAPPLMFEIIFDAFLHCQCKAANSLAKTYTEVNAVRQVEGGGECSDGDLAGHILASLVRLALPPPPDAAPGTSEQFAAAASTAAAHRQARDKLLAAWAPLLKKLVSKSEADQVALLKTYCAVCEGAGQFKGWFGEHVEVVVASAAQALNLLYDADVLTEEAVMTWAAGERATGRMGSSAFCVKVAPFVQWLEEAEEDDDDEDDDEDDDDE